MNQNFDIDLGFSPKDLTTALMSDITGLSDMMDASNDYNASSTLGEIDWTLTTHSSGTEDNVHGLLGRSHPASISSNEYDHRSTPSQRLSDSTAPSTCPPMEYSVSTFASGSSSHSCGCLQGLASCLYRLNDTETRTNVSIRRGTLQNILEGQTLLLDLAGRLKTCAFGCLDRPETKTMLVVCTQNLVDFYAEITLQYRETGMQSQSCDSHARNQLPVVVGDCIVDNHTDRQGLITFLLLSRMARFKTYMGELQDELGDHPNFDSLRGRVVSGLKSLGESIYRLRAPAQVADPLGRRM
jgi:hypothetical protein